MQVSQSPEVVGQLMAAYRGGDPKAGSQLLELFYPELKRMAVRLLNGERQGHSWQPTLLVNELYIQLVKAKVLAPAENDRQNDRGTFFALAGQVMKRLLIHHARPLASKAKKVPLWDDIYSESGIYVLEVEQVLARLEAIRPVLRQVVEMKVFEGMTAEEIATRLGCATVTVNRHWQFSRHWLRAELGQ